MLVDAEILVLPYASQEGRSLLGRLILEFTGGGWTTFHGAIGFVKRTGNFPDLLAAMEAFAADEHRTLSLTFGADIFGNSARGSDYDAVDELLDTLHEYDNVKIHLYHESGRTFHPKLFLFADEASDRALLIIGSSNWSGGGLVDNVEANVLIRLDLGSEDQRACFDDVITYFKQYWMESDG